MIDITMTATWRPDLLERTLSSFFTNMWTSNDERLRLIINVDPTGSDTDKYNEIFDIVRYFFEDNFLIQQAPVPHFPSAVKWVWEQVTSPIFFNLEEDWELLYPIDWNEMVWCIKDRDNVAHIRLSVFKSTDSCKNWKVFYNWNGIYFQCPADDKGAVGWCGHPSLNKTSFIKEAMKHIDFAHNPEKQIKGRGSMKALIDAHIFGSFIQPNSPANIKDIGREWMVKNGWKKQGKNKEWFTTWEKADGTSVT